MRLESVSNAPQFYVAPLVSAEQTPIAKAIREIASQAFEWIRSIFRFIFRIEKPVKPVPSTAKVLQAAQQVEALRRSKPGLLGNLSFKGIIGEYFKQNTIPLGIAGVQLLWNRATENFFSTFQTVTSAFVARKVVDIASNVFAETATLFFPSAPYAIKKITGLVLAGPAIWNAADTLGYRQGYMFLFGVFMSTVPFCSHLFSQHKARKQRELQRQQFAAPPQAAAAG